MNASDFSRLPLTPISSRPVRAPHRKRNKNRLYLVLTLETSTKLLLSSVFLAGMIAALFRLVPYHQTQSEKLKDLKQEVALAEDQVGNLRQDFTRYFDPTQTGSLMQEYSNRLAPGQRRVIFIENFTLNAKGSVNVR